MNPIELTDYRTVEAALKEADLKQSLYDEGSLLMNRVLVTLHGDEHRARRLTEMRVFRRDFFKHYEREVLPAICAEVMAQVDTDASINLVDLNYQFMVYLAIAFAGIDRQQHTQAELDTLVHLLRMFGVAATLGQAKDQTGVEAAKLEVTAALQQFTDEFFNPSAVRREQLLQDGAEDMPMDVLSVLLEDEPKLKLGRDMMMRETGFFFLASAHTSVHSMGHAVAHLLAWCEAHPEARAELQADPLLVQRFVHESFRLHPSSPVAKRVALADVTFLDGQRAQSGETVIINLRQANRDSTVFGADAGQFNPYRQLPRGLSETGVTFGIGMHACLGKFLAAGQLPVPGKTLDAETHQLGTVAYICHRLLTAGVQRDHNQEAHLDQTIERETWQTFPIAFGV
ncbi:MAG: cytochrome P450 [Pseudomonadota bacterium]